VAMRPIFSLHAGEYLVGNAIYENLEDEFDVWVPGKDILGVDLLLTSKAPAKRSIKVQVKFSKDFTNPELDAGSWFALFPEKIKESNADFWVFAIYTIKNGVFYIVIPTSELIKRIPVLSKNKKWNLYLNVRNKSKCYDERNDAHVVDYSQFLNNWRLLKDFANGKSMQKKAVGALG